MLCLMQNMCGKNLFSITAPTSGVGSARWHSSRLPLRQPRPLGRSSVLLQAAWGKKEKTETWWVGRRAGQKAGKSRGLEGQVDFLPPGDLGCGLLRVGASQLGGALDPGARRAWPGNRTQGRWHAGSKKEGTVKGDVGDWGDIPKRQASRSSGSGRRLSPSPVPCGQRMLSHSLSAALGPLAAGKVKEPQLAAEARPPHRTSAGGMCRNPLKVHPT